MLHKILRNFCFDFDASEEKGERRESTNEALDEGCVKIETTLYVFVTSSPRNQIKTFVI